ncbi:hypothetical protein EB796_017352 [Bugula neritina]|uniref:Uncharacterized protein n=1 Tax=Bugula neritina TaxID=10212 RepID=A0A7J7JFI2_BUGNE|nr:hypothetical protein EB796_017352 [Bugula neritina]
MLLQKIAPMYDNMKVTFVISYPFSTLMDNLQRTCGGSYVANCEYGDHLKGSPIGAKTKTWTCTCGGNLCNGGSQLTYSAALFGAVSIKFLF